MKKAMSVSLSIIFTILILFGPGCAINPWILVKWQFYVVVLATVVMFSSQPSLTKADLLNPTDKYSMLGISVMALLVTNSSVIEWALENDQHKVLRLINYVGFCMIWGGLALRIFSIASLNRYFSNAAKIQPAHQLIDKGIYGIIRHPSYTGATSEEGKKNRAVAKTMLFDVGKWHLMMGGRALYKDHVFQSTENSYPKSGCDDIQEFKSQSFPIIFAV